MENPLTMAKNAIGSLPMFDKSVPDGTFRRGFMSGASNGALMMGIFYTLGLTVGAVPMAAAGIAATVLHILPAISVGVFSTGLFSGIMASRKASGENSSAARASVAAYRREPVHAPESFVGQAYGADIDQSQPATTRSNWTNRVTPTGSGRDRISQIIADGRLSDKDRASAILKERELSTASTAKR